MTASNDGRGSISGGDPDHVTIRFERRLAAPIERVWAALTVPSELAGWLSDSSVDLRRGGLIAHTFEPGDDGSRVQGRILVVDPPTTLEYEWRFRGETHSILRYDLVADGTGTLLTLTHRMLGTAQASGYAAGWHAYLDALEAVLSGAEPAEWAARFAEVRSAYLPASSG